jgi:phosphatidylserine/phosphatidylglycerophosphate/cardiolipin synthase-like enzyme
MIVDDAFCTLGSANVNTRSMQVDSELNVCIEDPAITRPLREHLFGVHMGEDVAGQDIKDTYDKWARIIWKNDIRRMKKLEAGKKFELGSPVASLVEFLQESESRKNLD